MRAALKVRLGAVVSSAVALWMVTAAALAAHEVFPSIADMTQDGARVTFSVETTIEGFVAGIDLAEVANTNEAAQADTYDSLRALSPEEMADRFEAFWPDMAQKITVLADGEPVTPGLVSITVMPEQNLELPRKSTFVFDADMPPGTETVTFGWDRAFGAVVVRQMDVEAPYDGYIDGGDLTDAIVLAGGGQAGPWATFVDYIPTGFDHIVPKGLDHILFVLGLFFLSTHFRPLLWQVTMFTLAHTITLALAALGYVSVPGAIVEPLIAASIVFVAVENIFSRGLSPWRPVVIFGFGLLHGLGFASVLAEFGLPDNAFVPALIGFNIGVEVGQLFVILCAFGLVFLAVRVDRGRPEVTPAIAFYAVLAVAFGALAWITWSAPVARGWMAPLNGEVPLWLFAAPVATLSLLCGLSVLARDRIDAYRRIVAIPASLAIASVGTWWVIERTLL